MGAGALSLPATVSAIGDVPGAIGPVLCMVVVMAAFSAYSFSTIAELCEKTSATSFDEAWAATVGEKSQWVLTSSIAACTGLACLAYSMIIGDCISALAASFGATGLLAERTTAILGVTGLVVLPLCCLKSLAALSYTSLLGVMGVIFTTIVMGIRKFDGSYLPSGRFFETLPETMKPLFGVKGFYKLDHMTFVILSCLSTAFLAHFNAPTFYAELKGRSLKKFNKVVAAGFGISTLVFSGLISFGFGTFGSATAGNIMNNYAVSDALATICRVAIGFSIIFTYPLGFVGLKNSVFSLLKIKAPTDKQNYTALACLLGPITLLALKLTDLGFIAALTGSLMGSLIIYVFPGLMKHKLTKMEADGKPLTFKQKAPGITLMSLGAVLGMVGVAVTLLQEFTTILG